jgi:hypothetical protein
VDAKTFKLALKNPVTVFLDVLGKPNTPLAAMMSAVIVLKVAGSISQTAARVLVSNMRDVGFTVEEQPRDWPTIPARRAKKDLIQVSGLHQRHRHVLPLRRLRP